ncbi:hypothetical protein [Bradyrhizobium sp. LMG 9283]|uniref:hypothetical protein n=1 Tax=Bradyrhizobium sp. LMG 9283 TaxID=592064 RepID=UPI00388E02AC
MVETSALVPKRGCLSVSLNGFQESGPKLDEAWFHLSSTCWLELFIAVNEHISGAAGRGQTMLRTPSLALPGGQNTPHAGQAVGPQNILIDRILCFG